MECEARAVLVMSKPERDAYYADVRKRRGDTATMKLIREVNRQWNSRQPSLL